MESIVNEPYRFWTGIRFAKCQEYFLDPANNNVYVMEWSDLYDEPYMSHKEFIKPTRFTGILDIKNRPIYEGDILRGEFGEFLYVVEFGVIKSWDKQHSGFYLKCLSFNDNEPHFDLDQWMIVGNIFENPELQK